MSRSSLLRAPADSVWATLADFAGIGSWAPNVTHSSAASESVQGVGAVRRVQVGRLALLERITQWVPGEQLSYQIEGLPPVAGEVITTWELEPKSAATLVTVTTVVTAASRPPGPLVGRVVARRMGSAADAMLRGLACHVERIQERT